ncbi:polysaccharide deacetylase familiy protein [Paenibacillus albidus]|uniref:Polysaccharide deacetylase familiy protein n=1 Tax=Paenibacillus albidus TaxID=2041023 RepID=A0A917CW09_9BACL|nr:polysaccharide deacetylase family protein [Paenibacillus albidus]GGG01647.1 polysaccharide deacetylase familiy protein [Paenibacillus albidus]
MILAYLAGAGLGLATLYMFIPSILTRMIGWGVLRKGHTKHRAAFTFDDGPHPQYTPRLLDLLKQHQVKATFFVLGSQAEQYPELIRRMHREGHQIGIHNYEHISNWLMLPGTIRREHLERSADIIESIIGIRPSYYRPPWGLINIFDFFLRKPYRIALWSLIAGDWSSRVCRTKLRSTLLSQITDGTVVVLHDSGEAPGADRNAPYFMLEALEEVLGQLQSRDLQFVRLDELAVHG